MKTKRQKAPLSALHMKCANISEFPEIRYDLAWSAFFMNVAHELFFVWIN